MDKPENIKTELSNFWLKQLDQIRANPVNGIQDKPSPKVSPLMPDLFSRRQLQRVNGHARGKRERSGSAGVPTLAGNEKRLGGRPATVVKIESNRDASTADKLRKWLNPNAAAEPCEGQFYIAAVDVLSLKQAQRDWDCSAGNVAKPVRSHLDWSVIDASLMWLSAPSA